MKSGSRVSWWDSGGTNNTLDKLSELHVGYASHADAADSATNATTANSLATSGTIRTNLASTSTATYTNGGNITPGVTGTLPVANGGTGQTDLDNVTVGSAKDWLNRVFNLTLTDEGLVNISLNN